MFPQADSKSAFAEKCAIDMNAAETEMAEQSILQCEDNVEVRLKVVGCLLFNKKSLHFRFIPLRLNSLKPRKS